MIKSFALGLTLLSLWSGALRAGDNPFNLPRDTDEALRQTFTALFNENFEEAEQKLAPLKAQKQTVPVVALAFVVKEWWRMSLGVLETDAQASAPFLEEAELCGKLAKDRLNDKKLGGQAAFAWGTTLGLLSRWSVANRAWIAAYVRGTKAVDQSERALKRHPDLADAYMTIGTFNYAQTLLSSYMDGDAARAAQIDSNEGIQQLKFAAARAIYFQQASNLMLAGILTNDAPQEAVPLLVTLHSQLPNSAFIHMVLMTALYNTGDITEMKNQLDQFNVALESGTYPASYRPQAFFVQGLLALRDKKWREAAAEFAEAIKVSTPENPYQPWSHLYRGYALDMIWGKRKEAVREYNTVLQLRRCFASHDHARARIQTPFRPTDVEMKRLEL